VTKISRQAILYFLSGLVLVFAWLVAGGVFDDPEPLCEALPLALLGGSLFAFAHVP
jgi:hypothetical protein